MKTLKFFAITWITLSFAISTQAQISNSSTLKSGIYYILNGNGEAIEPLGPTPGNHIFLKNYSKSGMQKWKLIPQKNGSYLLQLIDSELYLEPHSAGDRTALLDSTIGKGYLISPVEGTENFWIIKSKTRNGDAMRSFVFSKEAPTEIRFEAFENNQKFYWQFVPAN